jgi:hypothetical protein
VSEFERVNGPRSTFDGKTSLWSTDTEAPEKQSRNSSVKIVGIEKQKG